MLIFQLSLTDLNIKRLYQNIFYPNKSRSIFNNVLINWSPYYRELSPALKRRFLIRSIRLYRKIDFNAHEDFDLSRQMKIIISSAFIQLTFGLRRHTLRHYREIHVMPSRYSYGNSVYYSGDVNRQLNRITLSWKAVKKGFEIHDDALNVCLHEFGHSLLFENRASILYYYFDTSAWEHYKKEAKKKYIKIKKNEHRLLRDYAGKNLYELFSVAIEAFFEQPYDFHSAEPGFYRALSNLLKQDPRRKKHPLIKEGV